MKNMKLSQNNFNVGDVKGIDLKELSEFLQWKLKRGKRC